MSVTTKTLALAALAGLIGSGAPISAAHATTNNGQTYKVAEASTDASTDTTTDTTVVQEKHACKGQNSCKGKGKDGKNSCKGKGSCATDGSK